MRVGKVLSRLRLSLIACLAVAAFAGVLVGSASAAAPSDASGLAGASEFNPQETNVPYLAWRGEEVRLVKCVGGLTDAAIGGPTLQTDGLIRFLHGGFDINMSVYEYSGPQENSFDGPKSVQNNAAVFSEGRRICVRGSWISNKAGIVVIKLTVSFNGVILGQHDFLIGWMAVNSANMVNAGSVTENPGVVPGNSANVQVTGSIPLNQEFQDDWGLPSQLIMPNDWALWAHTMATTDQYLGSLDPSAYWDIHDSSGPLGNESPDGSPDVHINKAICSTGTVGDPFVDQVDDCTGDEGLYSRIFGDLTTGETGPFDQSYSSTLLSDGRLNSSDAPMPALKIVYNSSGGMGGFANSCLNDKDNVYNRNVDVTNPVASGEEQNGPYSQLDCIKDGTSENDAHALYAPYYSQYIPATSRNPFGAASGIDGPIYTQYTGQPNNFTGFGWYGQYENWQIANELVSNVASDTTCRLRDNPLHNKSVWRQSNGFPTRVIIFTDEHGEARANWLPGLGADFFNDVFVDMNGGCDLEGLQFPSQTITASARYPFQPVGTDIPVAGSITKNINNLFHKSVSCVRKDNTSSAIAYICTASAQDIDGNGYRFNGEKVCFSREPDGSWYAFPNPGNPLGNPACVYLSGGTSDSPAEASVETDATRIGENIDVAARFVDEHLIRDACITVGQAASVDGPCNGVGGGTTTTTTTTTTSGTTAGTTAGTTTTSGTITTTTRPSGTAPNSSGRTIRTSVVSVQLVLTRTGRVLMVNVRSAKKTAKIQIRLVNAKGKVISVIVRTVKTNKRVAVSNLRISPSVKTVRVKVLS
jgi:hypothetical protein